MQLHRHRFEEIYSRFLESGLSAKDFCSNESFPLRKFYYWKKRIATSSHPLVHNGFLPLSIDLPDTSPSHVSGTGSQLEIVYKNGTTLRLHGNISIQEILTLLNPQ